MRRLSLFAVLCSLLLPALAQAADAPIVLPVLAPAERAQRDDASIDRGILGSHAETIGEGKFAINSYELFLIGAAYGVTRDVEISLTTSIPIVRDQPHFLLGNVKYAFFRGPLTTVSVQGTLDYAALGTGSGDKMGLFGAGILADHILIEDFLTVHGAIQALGGAGDFNGSGVQVGSGAVVLAQAGVDLRVTHFLKIMSEFWIPGANIGQAGDRHFEFASVSLFSYGARFHGEHVSADLSFLKFIGNGMDYKEFPLGLPYVAFNGRF